jgi:hypothetical protein
MNSKFIRDISIIGIALAMAIVYSFLSVSCSEKKEKDGSKDILSEKDLINVLTEIHIADGLLTLPKIRKLYEDRDSIMNYLDIIHKNGYTKDQMDRTMRYYFSRNPKKLIKIYDKVLEKLSKMHALIEKEITDTNIPAENLWKGSTDISLSYYSGTDTLIFDQLHLKPGTYILGFTLTLFPDDQSVNPRFNAYLCHPDSIDSGKRDYYPSIHFIKDGLPHYYTFSQLYRPKAHTRLRGSLIDCDNSFNDIFRHGRISDISLTCIPSQ